MVISGQLANSDSQKTVLSGTHKGSIKQTNTSQVLVSETVPDRRVQPSREAKKTRFQDNPGSSTVRVPPRRQPGCDTSTRNRRKFRLDVCDPDLLLPLKQTQVNERHSDLREPQTSSSDSYPASSQPVSQTTTSESSMPLPSSPSGSSCTTSTSTSGTDSSLSETSSESSSQPSSNASSPETTTSASSSLINIARTVRDGALFQQLARRYQREARTCCDEETDGQSERATTTGSPS